MSSTDRKKPQATLLGKLMVFYPALIIFLTLFEFIHLIITQNIYHFFMIIFILYFLPVITFRIHNLLFPLIEENTIFPSGKYPAWWGSLYIQRIYLSIPLLENILRMLPGFYSFWLRLWGSKVGKNIFYATQMEISDRSLLEIGDFVIFGNQSGYYSHILSPTKDGRMLLMIKKITIGNNVFIGAWSTVGPGISIPDNTKIPLKSNLYHQTDLRS
ncbi:MAG: hypothetical protein A2381_01750 [Bdellovibrionales bacterium RIFOXYB1_FULL_37_110]|nr:MAG: hypothetical protein A2417_15765 [Bdellovibrionales bacterium RIFOXYC1_FULL_37_79]OFZ58939.1 MAG: hypothetical protein A2381_01750 [Bdellovibrionales bacterium RIFOXYB1_FULL_37_110]OFZ64615.1 MAG: hypothetical protein A2577_13185 [Bdellovibrionales bacterium RIFOXYD1_FULL_36_51]